MASRWGDSWGDAWGASWDFGEASVAVIPPQIIGGGYVRPERTQRQLAKDRARFGIPDEAAQVIADIAARQAERLELDAQKRFEELSRELELRRIEWDAQYLEVLNETRQRLIDKEIASRLASHLEALALKTKKQNEKAVIALMALAVASI